MAECKGDEHLERSELQTIHHWFTEYLYSFREDQRIPRDVLDLHSSQEIIKMKSSTEWYEKGKNYRGQMF